MFFEEGEGLLGKAKEIISKYTIYLKILRNAGVNWPQFMLFFLVGTILILISIPFASFLLLNPKPFCMLFSLGSAIILISIIQLIKLKTIFHRIWHSIAFVTYLTSMTLSIYAGVFYIGYLNTLAVLFIQILSLIYLTVSLFPGGKNGMHLAFKNGRNIVKNLFVKQTSFLPL